MKRFVLADDLTGANNVGVLLTKQGLSTVVVTYEVPAFSGAYDVLCVDTDSRYVPSDEAAQRVQAVVEGQLSRGPGLFCNRVDNLLRGNIGAETAGMLRALGPDALAVVAPAFPALKRHVTEGCLIVDGTPVAEHPIAAKDPIAPVRHSRIADILAQQFSAPISVIGLPDVESGTDALARRLEREASRGSRAVVIDADTDEHLDIIAQAMTTLTRPCIPVDPGPLSALYLRGYGQLTRLKHGHKVLVSVGSVTQLSRKQVNCLLSRLNAEPIRLDASALLGPDHTKRSTIEAAVTECLQRAKSASTVIVLTTHPLGREPIDLETIASERGAFPRQIAKEISDGLAEATLETLDRSQGEIGGCFSSGGDVTASLFHLAEAEAIKILGDVIPLTAYVELIGGRLHGLRMVTKGGSIGGESTLVDCVRFLLDELQPALD
ncbi:MAG: four-carbon acid sugar kinase family protein [Gammaproteobacteria bacterium]